MVKFPKAVEFALKEYLAQEKQRLTFAQAISIDLL